jgi:hypothetical protein
MTELRFRYFVKPLSRAAQSALLDLLAKSPEAGASCEPCCIEVCFETITDVYLVSEEVLERFAQLPCALESRVFFQAYGQLVRPFISFAKKVQKPEVRRSISL